MNDKISRYKSGKNIGYHFHCEGCGSAHGVFIKGSGVPIWKWNGDLEKPTFTPSVLLKYKNLSKEGNKLNKEFYKKHGRYMTLKELPYDSLYICHSYITDGKIRYLNDCTHHLKGKTVELLDF